MLCNVDMRRKKKREAHRSGITWRWGEGERDGGKEEGGKDERDLFLPKASISRIEERGRRASKMMTKNAY